MRLFQLTFPGVYLGGTGIVAAESPQEALKILNGSVEYEIKAPIVKELDTSLAGVLYLDDGDY